MQECREKEMGDIGMIKGVCLPGCSADETLVLGG